MNGLGIARIALHNDSPVVLTYWKHTHDLRVLVSCRRDPLEDRTAETKRPHVYLGKMRPLRLHLHPGLSCHEQPTVLGDLRVDDQGRSFSAE